ncbi:MAG: hypothetical protein LBI26_02885 [Holosporales bacterium]|nr:hypothetical protein [Holosporales bacterium]
MMILSIFIRGTNCYIANESEEVRTQCDSIQNVSEDLIVFMQNFLEKFSSKIIEKLVISSGPSSFTSMRVLNSIAKAFGLSLRNVKLVFISSFRTYLFSLPPSIRSGTIAISTMREDFFCMDFLNKELLNYRISPFIKEVSDFFRDSDPIFDRANLASVQLKVAY